ncbi:zonular occludens toxin domain-containing protein [Stenotrophomonas sp.]|uniref:zonular occludens toxin domain-containing protein n=1 Tax=Stenotrophomonas sp. TaxID=69392 RepID=UPI0028AF37D9|nr:zonular occludens toxin domain-containing protein [Stenotrophomonas sp.]
MSAIAATASITLLTGVPGNGKTLRAVWYIKQAISAGETVFACNVNGLNIEGVQTWDDPTEWMKLPPGSILVVDEAQRFFRAASGVAPPYITAMETIRHAGVRLILLTQSPALIHPNIRALVGLHEHLVRQGGKELATVYRRSRVMDNVRSEKALLAEDHESWGFPRELYGLYKSAEVHTVKHTMTSKMKRGLMLLVVVGGLIAYLVWNGATLFGGKTEPKAEADGATATTASAFGSVLPTAKDDGPKWASAAAYARAHLPRIGTMPWTSEVFDQRPVTADPQLFCISSSEGLDGNGKSVPASCTCLTEQGTRYEISQPECRTLARHGPVYNPYKQQSPVPQAAPSGDVSPAVAAGSADSSRGAYAGTVIEVGGRPMSTFPESVQNRYSGN